MQNQKIWYVVIGVIALAALLSGVYFFYQYKSSDILDTKTLSKVPNQPSRDLVASALAQNTLLREVRDALLAKDYSKAIELSRQVLATSSSTDERSVAENSIAQAYFSLEQYKEGATFYYAIYNNSEYLPTTRAAALNNIVQQYRGTRDRTILETIVGDLSSKTDEEIYDTLYGKIYEVHPLGMASAWMGTKALGALSRTDTATAKDVYNRFITDIDRDIEFQSKGTGSAYIVPNIYMAKARFMIFARSRFNLASIEEISATYERAANLAESRSNLITKQFALLEYVDFLGRENQIDKAEQVFTLFTSQKIEKVVASNFSQGKIASSWPGLAYLYTKSQLVKDFADKNGIKP